MRILLATNNANKRDELAPLLDPYGIEIVMPAALGGLPAVEEDRDTFAGNAAKKAVARTLGIPLARLPAERIAALDALLSETLDKPAIEDFVRTHLKRQRGD